MIRRLRRRFIRIAMLSVAVVMLLLTLIVNGANFASADSDLRRTLNMICENQGTIPVPDHFTVPDGDTPDPPEPPAEDDKGGGMGDQGSPFGPEAPFSTRYFVLRYDAEGNLISSDLSHIAAVTGDDVGAYLAAAVKRGAGYGYTGGYKYLVAADGEGYMAIFLDAWQTVRSLRTVAFLSLAADGVCIALVYLLVVLFSRRAIDPVVRSAERQKQFITDAGHELKTPLTVITTCLKVLEMEVGQQKWIDKAQAQADKMSGLVSSLVTLSRMDEEEPPIPLTDFDVSAAVDETAESFRDSAAAAGHDLTVDVPVGITYHGDEAAVRQLTSILLDNAVKYALPGGTISVSLRRERRGIVLRSGNPCAPLTREELDKLFDRFYRPDQSRTAATGGFGVGLSIARGIAEAHHGSITADCPEEGRIEFTAVLK